MKKVGSVVRGVLVAEVWEDKNSHTVKLYHGNRCVKTSEPYHDQDEAEVEIPAMMDTYVNELKAGQRPGLQRR